ncbi:hypothetical protein PBI_HILLTOPFARM_90 [Mycobacterium phage Hilltopfarm]|nr:hypothetical protein PBI_HILLTOPFARM_90 [Mycobacterium phage Hilltopfarm]
MVTEDHHRCRSAGNCVNADTKGTDEEGRTIRRGALVVDGLLCDGCLLRVQRSVRYMAKDWLRLRNHLGHRATSDTDKVGGTRTPGIPLNTQVEALMSRMVELAEHACAMVGKPVGASRGRSEQRDAQVINHAAQYLTPRVGRLLEVPPTELLVWAPIPDGDSGWDDKGGQPRERVELSGLDIAAQIVRANRRVGQLLGKDRLRHHYALPCPAMDARGRYCGAMTVGRDDGEARVNCTTCGASWTDAEYEFLSGLVLDEIKLREENDMLRYLLAEAYWRLDTLQLRADALAEQWEALVALLESDPTKAVEVAGLIREQLTEVLTLGDQPHPAPADRVPATRSA